MPSMVSDDLSLLANNDLIAMTIESINFNHISY